MSSERPAPDPHGARESDDAQRFAAARREQLARGVRASGLCPQCRHVKVITSERGSTFLLCQRARDDARFPKYPPQPVMACSGHES